MSDQVYAVTVRFDLGGVSACKGYHYVGDNPPSNPIRDAAMGGWSILKSTKVLVPHPTKLGILVAGEVVQSVPTSRLKECKPLVDSVISDKTYFKIITNNSKN